MLCLLPFSGGMGQGLYALATQPSFLGFLVALAGLVLLRVAVAVGPGLRAGTGWALGIFLLYLLALTALSVATVLPKKGTFVYDLSGMCIFLTSVVYTLLVLGFAWKGFQCLCKAHQGRPRATTVLAIS